MAHHNETSTINRKKTNAFAVINVGLAHILLFIAEILVDFIAGIDIIGEYGIGIASEVVLSIVFAGGKDDCDIWKRGCILIRCWISLK